MRFDLNLALLAITHIPPRSYTHKCALKWGFDMHFCKVAGSQCKWCSDEDGLRVVMLGIQSCTVMNLAICKCLLAQCNGINIVHCEIYHAGCQDKCDLTHSQSLLLQGNWLALSETTPASPSLMSQFSLLPAWKAVKSCVGSLCVSYRAPRARSLSDGFYEKLSPTHSGDLLGLLLLFRK